MCSIAQCTMVYYLKVGGIEAKQQVITVNQGLKPEDTLFFVHSHSSFTVDQWVL